MANLSAFSRWLISVLNYSCNPQMYRNTVAVIYDCLPSPAAAATEFLYTRKNNNYGILTTSQDTCPLHTRILLLTGPFIFKYLWGTSMWLKPNPYSTHVRTENLQTIWLFSQMLWNQGETINILAVAVRENIWDCRCILLCLVLVTKWGTSHRLDRKVNYRSWNSYMELSVVTKKWLQLTSQNAQIGAPLSPSKQSVMVF